MALISTKQAAIELGISVLRVQQLIRAGRLPAQKIGRDYVINGSDLELVRVRTPGRPKKAPDSKS